jgi:hypothetical protein
MKRDHANLRDAPYNAVKLDYVEIRSRGRSQAPGATHRRSAQPRRPRDRRRPARRATRER